MTSAETRYAAMFRRPLELEFDMLKYLLQNVGGNIRDILENAPADWPQSQRNAAFNRLVKRSGGALSTQYNNRNFFLEQNGQLVLNRQKKSLVTWLTRD